MSLDMGQTLDSFKEGTKEVAETAHVKTSEFHDNYVSKVVPDCGKYGDAARFVAELVPGVSEYNAIREGDWKSFAIAAGIDVAAIGLGVFTGGAGYAAIKGGSVAAKTGAKVAVKEVAKAGSKKVAKEIVETGGKKAVKEVTEAGAEKVVKETIEAGTEKAVKEATEATAEKAAKEVTEVSTEKATKEVVENGTEKVAKEGTEKLDDSVSQIVRNKIDGTEREMKVLKELTSKYGEDNIIREAYILDKYGNRIIDAVTGEARRIDMIVKDGNKIIKSIEVTSETASKELQIAKELRILEQAKDRGGVFFKDPDSGELLKLAKGVITEIRRLP